MARRSGAAVPKKSKATPVATKAAPTKKAKKVTKEDPEPAPAPVDDSDDDLEPAEPYKATLTCKRDRMVRKIQCTIPDGTSAVKKKQKKVFAQTIKLTSKKPFSLEPTLMTTGPYAGLSVLVLQPEPDEHETFPFLDLPAEIRNMIYSLVLERLDNNILLSGKHTGIIQPLWLGPKRNDTSRIHGSYSTSLIQVNKQISIESMPYLFTRHTFEFSDSTMMQRFLEYLGPERTKSLVSVQVDQQYSVSVRKAYALLSSAVSLTKLVIKSFYCYYYHSRSDWAVILLPLFQSLCSTGRSRDDVFDIITIQGAVRGSCQEHGTFGHVIQKDCKIEAKAYKDFYKKLREDIDKELDKAEVKQEAIKRGSPVKTRSGRNTKAIDYSGMDE